MPDVQEHKTIGASVAVEYCVDPEDEARLILLAQQEDVDAFERLISRYQKAVYNFALYLTNEREHASDIAQDAFVKVFRSLKNFRGDCSFKNWLFRVVRNVFIDDMRRQYHKCRAKSVNYDELTERDTVHEDGTEQRIIKEVLCNALERLSLELRTSLVMYELQGFSYEEISAIEGVGLGTVKSRIFKARKKLLKDKDLLECWALLQ